MIKTYSEFIKESFGSGCALAITTVNKRGVKSRDNYMFKCELDAREFMLNWLTKHPGGRIEYFDICTGSNYSDPDCLVVWGGYGGYFFNVVNSSYRDRQQFSYSEIKYIERCEVEIETYLKTR